MSCIYVTYQAAYTAKFFQEIPVKGINMIFIFLACSLIQKTTAFITVNGFQPNWFVMAWGTATMEHTSYSTSIQRMRFKLWCCLKINLARILPTFIKFSTATTSSFPAMTITHSHNPLTFDVCCRYTFKTPVVPLN